MRARRLRALSLRAHALKEATAVATAAAMATVMTPFGSGNSGSGAANIGHGEAGRSREATDLGRGSGAEWRRPAAARVWRRRRGSDGSIGGECSGGFVAGSGGGEGGWRRG